MKFIQSCPPALDAGEYRITAKQSLNASDSEQLPSVVKHFAVRGPRFSLSPNDVYSVFPANNHQGKFDNCLPQIVLTRKTLPWERTIDGSLPKRASSDSWLALILLSDDEVPDIQHLTLKDLINPPDGTIGPKITLDKVAGEAESDPCNVIDLPYELFQNIIPLKSELGYLSHARCINDDTYFSVVVGNRFPKSSSTGVKNSVHLISLEGLGDYFQAKNQNKKIRLVSLMNWSFVSLEAKYNFEDLVSNLSPGKTLSIPASKSATTEEEKFVENAFNMGYSANDHYTREGEKTVSWFRGPLVPLDIDKEDISSHAVSDSALKYNPETGMFDVSYASAWQIGKLLAIQDQHFAIALLKWRRENNQTAISELSRTVLHEYSQNLTSSLKSMLGGKAK